MRESRDGIDGGDLLPDDEEVADPGDSPDTPTLEASVAPGSGETKADRSVAKSGGEGQVPGLPRRAGRLTTGCKAIDGILGGGVETGALTELFGEAGSGKTNICLQLSREAALKGLKVAYIDTEGVSVERLAQICGERFGELSRRILFNEAFDMDEQEDAVDKAARLCEANRDMGLVVLDSSTIYYRMALGGEEEGQQRRSFAYQLTKLLNIARRKNVPAVVTSQVYFDSRKEQVCPIGGHLLDHQAKAILRLEKVGTGVRRATVCKHRSSAEGDSCLFYLTQEGVVDRTAGMDDGDE